MRPDFSSDVSKTSLDILFGPTFSPADLQSAMTTKNVKEAKIFAPTWDEAKTVEMFEYVNAAKAIALSCLEYGLQPEEVAMEIAECLPPLDVVSVHLNSFGTTAIIELF